MAKGHMSYPKNNPSRRLCIVTHRNGVTLYGNAGAFRSMSKWMSWLAASNPKERFEFHAKWNLESHFSKSPKIVVLRRQGQRILPDRNREVTFMMLPTIELEDLANFKPQKGAHPRSRTATKRTLRKNSKTFQRKRR